LFLIRRAHSCLRWGAKASVTLAKHSVESFQLAAVNASSRNDSFFRGNESP
jgi:hypothetical protein